MDELENKESNLTIKKFVDEGILKNNLTPEDVSKAGQEMAKEKDEITK